MSQAARAFLTRRQQRDASTQTEAFARCPGCDELEALLAEVLAENETLREELAVATAERSSPRSQSEWSLLSALAATPIAHGGLPAALDLGYMVLRTPDHLRHLRGHHRVEWHSLLRRLGLTPGFSRQGYYIRRFQLREQAEAQWTAQRLQLPFPVDPQGEPPGSSRHV